MDYSEIKLEFANFFLVLFHFFSFTLKYDYCHFSGEFPPEDLYLTGVNVKCL
jgi:hypothetical protein